MNKSILLPVAALMLMAACSSDNQSEQAMTDLGMAIKLQGSINGVTRANSNIQNDEFTEGTRVNVYINEITNNTASAAKYTRPMVYTVNPSGSMAPTSRVYPYFPTSGNPVHIFATYPTNVTESTRSFTVEDEQDKSDKYKASDLLYAEIENLPNTTAEPTLQFYHKLSKITVELVSGTGSPSLENAEVRLCNVYRTVSFDGSTGIVGGASGSRSNVLVSTNNNGARSAIIPPQTVNPGYFIKIKLYSGDVIYYSLAQDRTFESGKAYRYIITINKNGLEVAYDVEDWKNETGNVSGGRPVIAE